jgi:hypothetical protein
VPPEQNKPETPKPKKPMHDRNRKPDEKVKNSGGYTGMNIRPQE